LIEKILQEFNKSGQIIRRSEINEMLEQKAKSLISEIARKLERKIKATPKCLDIGEGKVQCFAYITRLDNDPLIVGPLYGRIDEINYEISIYIYYEKRLQISVKAWI